MTGFLESGNELAVSVKCKVVLNGSGIIGFLRTYVLNGVVNFIVCRKPNILFT